MPLDYRIRPKDPIPDDDRTPDKDDAFQWLERWRESGTLYEMTYEDMADESRFSRSHIRNTLRDYYEKAGELEATTDGGDASGDVTIHVPPGTDQEAYLQGFVDGWLQRKNQ